MAKTYFGSTLTSGSGTLTEATDGGFVVLTQTKTITQASTAVVSATFTVPAGSQLIDIIPDVLTAFDSATTAVLSVGSAAAGTQYVSSVNAKTAGRAATTVSAAQALAMADVTTNTSVVASVTPTGATTAGVVRVTLVYAQKV